MHLADAYPSPDISAWAMTAIAVVMVGSLVFWLVMVYVAARDRHEPRGGHGRDVSRAAPGEPGDAAHPGEAAGYDPHSHGAAV